jgi:hypothetical protein
MEESTVSLAQRCKREISSADWKKGDSYFRSNGVSRIKVAETRLTASVQGSIRYRVDVDWTDVESQHFLRVECNCPRFDDVGMCKHIAATLLEIDRRDIDLQIPGNSSLRLVSLDDGDSDVDNFEDDEYLDADYYEDEDVIGDAGSNFISPRRPERPKPRTLAKPSAASSDFSQRLTKIERAFSDFQWRAGRQPQLPAAKPRQLITPSIKRLRARGG